MFLHLFQWKWLHFCLELGVYFFSFSSCIVFRLAKSLYLGIRYLVGVLLVSSSFFLSLCIGCFYLWCFGCLLIVNWAFWIRECFRFVSFFSFSKNIFIPGYSYLQTCAKCLSFLQFCQFCFFLPDNYVMISMPHNILSFSGCFWSGTIFSYELFFLYWFFFNLFFVWCKCIRYRVFRLFGCMTFVMSSLLCLSNLVLFPWPGFVSVCSRVLMLIIWILEVPPWSAGFIILFLVQLTSQKCNQEYHFWLFSPKKIYWAIVFVLF